MISKLSVYFISFLSLPLAFPERGDGGGGGRHTVYPKTCPFLYIHVQYNANSAHNFKLSDFYTYKS